MLNLIVAMDENGLIGRDNSLPWHLPADLKYFKEKTKSRTIIMGRKTYESIGRILPNRQNIILSNNKKFIEEFNYNNEHKLSASFATDNLNHTFPRLGQEFFVIGGSEIFKTYLPFINLMYITVIHNKFEGNTYFPEVDWSKWKIINSESHFRDDKNQFNYKFLIYKRC